MAASYRAAAKLTEPLKHRKLIPWNRMISELVIPATRPSLVEGSDQLFELAHMTV